LRECGRRGGLHSAGDGCDSQWRGVLSGKRGYAALESLEVRLGNGEVLPIVRMAKEFKKSSGTEGGPQRQAPHF